jgi:phosphoribosyl-AMP cyclohydrolase
MQGYMNAEALRKTIQTGEAHYFSRSRQASGTGRDSGLVQSVRELLIDDDQDCVWLRVDVAASGASCHVGYRSCFYRRVALGGDSAGKPLEFTTHEKLFDPVAVYGDAPNPTKL